MNTKSTHQSQRREGFNGGIQTGTTANTTDSIRLDKQVSFVAGHIASHYAEEHGLKHIKLVPRHMFTKFADLYKIGCAPDGGVFFRNYGESDQMAVCAFEAKVQGPGGNAIERWWKNRDILHFLKCARYVTFGAGDGALPGKPIFSNFGMALEIEGKGMAFDVVHPTGVSCFLAPGGFSAHVIRKVMLETLEINPRSEEIDKFEEVMEQHNLI